MGSEEARQLCDDAWNEAKDKNNHMYNFLWVFPLVRGGDGADKVVMLRMDGSRRWGMRSDRWGQAAGENNKIMALD